MIRFNFSGISDFHITFREQLLNVGNGIFQKVMEKVMESHGILASQTCTNPVTLFSTL